MNEDSFFEVLEAQYSNELPFVVYSRPINSTIKCWLQKDNTLHKTESFTESGFVFAPFDFKNESIVLPEAKCHYYVLETTNLKDDNRIKQSIIS